MLTSAVTKRIYFYLRRNEADFWQTIELSEQLKLNYSKVYWSLQALYKKGYIRKIYPFLPKYKTACWTVKDCHIWNIEAPT